MIPKDLLQEQIEIREILMRVKDWESKYLKQYGEGRDKWKTLRIGHLKRFEPFCINNIMLEKKNLEKQFLKWVKSDEIPTVLYWTTEKNYKFLDKNERYSFKMKNIDAGMEDQVKEINKAAEEGNIEGFGVSNKPWWKFW
jgi:hypothetical protein